MAWIGTAMYVAFAAGAPIGAALYARFGFAAIALATTLLPLVALILAIPIRPVNPPAKSRPAFTQVIGAVWLPGIGLAFSSVGFGATITFVGLLFVNRGWSGGWQAFTGFSGAFVIARLVWGHLPDRHGGARVASICLVVEAAGQALIWFAPSPSLALCGAVLTGLGYALVYPGFGVVAVRSAPPQSRALAMGAYTAFLDLALGLASPALGLLAGREGIAAVFLIRAASVMCATLVTLPMMATYSHPQRDDDGARS